MTSTRRTSLQVLVATFLCLAAGNAAAHPLHGGSEVDLNTFRHVDSEFTRVANGRCGTCCTDDSFGRNASHVQAVASHETAFNDRDFRTKAGSSGGCAGAPSTC